MDDFAGESRRQLTLALTRGEIHLTDDTGVMQVAQVEVGPLGAGAPTEIYDNVPMAYFYGFTANPPAGTQAIVAFQGGRRSQGVVLGCNHQQYRPQSFEVGAVALYDLRGASIALTSGGLQINAAGLAVTIENAASITLTGTATVTVNAPHVIINSDDVELGGTGGAAVARVGDTVAGGVITSGSSKVKAA